MTLKKGKHHISLQSELLTLARHLCQLVIIIQYIYYHLFPFCSELASEWPDYSQIIHTLILSFWCHYAITFPHLLDSSSLPHQQSFGQPEGTLCRMYAYTEGFFLTLIEYFCQKILSTIFIQWTILSHPGSFCRIGIFSNRTENKNSL